MKAATFRYECPTSLEEALSLLSDSEAEVAPLAGGQSLMPMMNFRMARPEVVLDLNRIAGLSGIRVSDGWLQIGAMTRYAALAASPDVARHAPLITQALPFVAHAAIRNRGTLGGSLALADPAAEMPAVMLALDAVIVLQSTRGQREVSASEFFQGIYDTARTEDELITEIRLPVAVPDHRFGFHEVARRHGDYAMAGCCLRVGDNADALRIAFFSISDRALRAESAEALLGQGKGLDAAEAALDELAFEGDQNASPAMKRHLAGVCLRRAWAGGAA